jgi:hypothetical protein
MLATVHEYAREILDTVANADAARRRSFFRDGSAPSRVSKATIRLRGLYKSSGARQRARRPQFAFRSGHTALGLRMVSSLEFWRVRPRDRGTRWLAQGLSVPGDAEEVRAYAV